MDYRILTIEGAGKSSPEYKKVVAPLNFKSKDPNFASGLGNVHFNWRWMTTNNGDKFRAVTIEDASGYGNHNVDD